MRCGVTTTILLLGPLDNHILRLRHKLERDPSRPAHFRTLRVLPASLSVALLLPGGATPNTSIGMEAAGMRLSTIASCRKRSKGVARLTVPDATP
jgi:hypothetical protein